MSPQPNQNMKGPFGTRATEHVSQVLFLHNCPGIHGSRIGLMSPQGPQLPLGGIHQC
jgi:hypothetical protein